MIRVLGRARPSTLALWMSVPLLVSAPLRAGAQVVATSFEELKAIVKPGDTIDVTETTGRKIKGRLGELSASSLELLVRKTGPDGRDAFVPRHACPNAMSGRFDSSGAIRCGTAR